MAEGFTGKKLQALLGMLLPFILPLGVFVIWFHAQCNAEENAPAPLHIVASVNLEGGRTTSFSTILEDGNEALWQCSAGTFIETGTSEAGGRSVTWRPPPDLEDSVTIVVTTPSVSDTVRFLPVIPDVTPSISVSAAYHLSILERARTIHVPPGAYRAVSAADDLSGYDGLVILIVKPAKGPRRAYGMLPGDTLLLNIPLGATIRATGLDRIEDAMDNEGSIRVTFEILTDSTSARVTDSSALPEPSEETHPPARKPQ